MKIILDKENIGYFYKIRRYPNIPLKMLTIAYFLTDDVTGKAQSWKNSIDKHDSISSNASFVYKSEGGDKIYIEHMWFGEEYTEEGTVEFSLEQFIYLLDQWDKFRKLRVQEIVITWEEGGDLTVEGREELEQNSIDC